MSPTTSAGSVYPRTQPPFAVVVSAKASTLARDFASRPGLPETTSRSSFGWFAGVKDRCTVTRPQSSTMSTRSFGHLAVKRQAELGEFAGGRVGGCGRRRQVKRHALAGLAALLGVHLLYELLDWIALGRGLGGHTAHGSGQLNRTVATKYHLNATVPRPVACK